MKKRIDNCIAEGEVTGHAHRVSDADVFGDGVDRLLVAPNGTTVTHEEHKPIELPPDEYDISRQREIDPDTDEARAVAD